LFQFIVKFQINSHLLKKMNNSKKDITKLSQGTPMPSEMAHPKDNKSSLCPSSPPDTQDSVVFGIVGGTVDSPQVAYLREPQPITDELLALSEPVDPTEVYRIAYPCWERKCQHFDGHQCHLIQQIVEGLPTVVKDLPPCRIRQDCRWWQQEGKAACLRCPQIVRTNYSMSETVKKVIEPHRDREIM
jgi:hypothetical protein